MSMVTVETGENGRERSGRFAVGNEAAKGHKHRRHVAKLRRAFTEALTESDILGLVAKLLELSAGGDVAAIRIVLDRALGRTESPEAIAMADAELDAEEELQDATQMVRSLYPDCPEEEIPRRARLMVKIQNSKPEVVQAVLQRLKARKAQRAEAEAAEVDRRP